MLVNRTKREFEDIDRVSHSLCVSLCVSHLECGRTPTRHTNRCATPQTAPEWRCLSAVQPHAQFRVFAYVSAGLVGDVAFRPRKIDFFASFLFSFFFGKKIFFFGFFFVSVWVRKLSKKMSRDFFFDAIE